MAGSRKFGLEYLSRDDIAALTREAADVSGISYIMDVDKREAEKILESNRAKPAPRRKPRI